MAPGQVVTKEGDIQGWHLIGALDCWSFPAKT